MPPRLFLIDGYALIYRAFFAMISRPLRTSQGREHLGRLGRGELPPPAAREVPARLRRLGQRRRHLVPRRSATPTTSPPARSWTRSCRRTSTARSSGSSSCSRLPNSAGGRAGLRSGRRDRTLATRAAAARPAGGHRLRRQGFLSAHRARRRRCSTRAAAGRPPSRRPGWTSRTPRERLGVPPRQVVDFLALVGDSSDNMPGVKGIGEKGAQKLLAEYGDLETMLAARRRGGGEAGARGAARPEPTTRASPASWSRSAATCR